MSRAFVKEVDDAPLPPPLERPVGAAPNLVTPRDARLIEQAIVALEARRADSKAPRGRGRADQVLPDTGNRGDRKVPGR